MKKRLLGIFILLMVVISVAACADTGIGFTVNFESNGGTYCAPIKTNGSNSIKMPKNPTKDNYEFDGWFWDDGVWNQPFTFNSILDKQISETMTLSVYAKWTIINKNQIKKPTLNEMSFVYDATAKTISLSSTDNSAYTLTEDITKTSAGNYTALVRLNDPTEYEWEDGSNEDLSLAWSISKAKVNKPVLYESNFTYDGNSKTPALDKQNDLLFILGRDIQKTNAGNYVISVDLKDNANYEWSDDTADTLLFNWSIAKDISTPEILSDITAGFGQTLSQVTLPTGWTWLNPTDLVGDTGERTHYAEYTPVDTNNYTATMHLITVKVNPSISNIRVDSLNLQWDSLSEKHKIYFQIDGAFILNDRINSDESNQINVLDIPADATAIGIEQLNSQGASQERVVINLEDEENCNVSIYSIDCTNIFNWKSLVSIHLIYFLCDGNWTFDSEKNNSYSVLDIPTDASEMRIMPIAWSYHSANKTLIKPLPYDIAIATVTPSTGIAVDNIRIEKNRLTWDLNGYYSNFRIYDLIEGVWQFDKIVTGNSLDFYNFVERNIEAIRIAPVGWNIFHWSIVNNNSEPWQLVRITPTIVSVEKTSEELVTNLRMEKGELIWDSPTSYHFLFAKVDGIWQKAGKISYYCNGGSISPNDFSTSYEAYRIVPDTNVYVYNKETTTLKIISPLPTDIKIEETEEGIEVFSDLRIENSMFSWYSIHGGTTTLYYKIDGNWVDYGYNNSGYIWLNEIPQGAESIRLVPIDGTAYSYNTADRSLIRHSELLPTEATFKESANVSEAITNVRVHTNIIIWDSIQFGFTNIYFKIDGQWILYSDKYTSSSFDVINIPDGATAIKIVMQCVYSFDKMTKTFLCYKNILPAELSLDL